MIATTFSKGLLTLKVNSKVTSLPDMFLENLIYCSHRTATRI